MTHSYGESVSSPDGSIKVDFTLDNGRPCYSILYRDSPVVAPSHLGMTLADGGADLVDGFEVMSTNHSSFDETWHPVLGRGVKHP